jgi:hypothetical protein
MRNYFEFDLTQCITNHITKIHKNTVRASALITSHLFQLECQDFTRSRCKIKKSSLVETLTFIRKSEWCKSYCESSHGDNHCKFFLHSLSKQTCQFYYENIEAFLSRCKKIGGPKNVNLEFCKSVSNTVKK